MEQVKSYWAIVRGPGELVYRHESMAEEDSMSRLLEIAHDYEVRLWNKLSAEFDSLGVQGDYCARQAQVARCGIRLLRDADGRRWTISIDRRPAEVLRGEDGCGAPKVQYWDELVAHTDRFVEAIKDRSPPTLGQEDVAKKCELRWILVRGPNGMVRQHESTVAQTCLSRLWELAQEYEVRLWGELEAKFRAAGVADKDLHAQIARCGIRLERLDNGKRWTLSIPREPEDVLDGVERSEEPVVQYTGEIGPDRNPLFPLPHAPYIEDGWGAWVRRWLWDPDTEGTDG